MPLLAERGHRRRSGSTATCSRPAPSAPPVAETLALAAQGPARRRRVGDLEGFDAVIHLAALSNDPLGRPQPGPDVRHQPRGLAAARPARAARPASGASSSRRRAATTAPSGDGLLDEHADARAAHALRDLEGALEAGARAARRRHLHRRSTCATPPPTASRRACASTSCSTT